MITKSLLTLSLLVLALSTPTPPPDDPSRLLTTSGDTTLPPYWFKPNSMLTVYFEITSPTITIALLFNQPNQFFAVGLGTTMSNADYWITEISSGTLTLTDCYSNSQAVSNDASSHLTLLGYEFNSTYTLVKFSRPLTTGDSQDLPITIGANNMLWATRAAGTRGYHSADRLQYVGNFVNGLRGTTMTTGDVSLPSSYFIVNSMLTIYFNIDATTVTLGIVFSVPNQFFSIGFGTQMLNADIWSFQINGYVLTVTDMLGQNHIMPTTDSSQDVTLLGYMINSTCTIAKVSRLLTTTDTANDKVITPGVNSMVWATRAATTIGNHGSTNRGIFNGVFTNGFMGTVGGAGMMGDYSLLSSYIVINSMLTMYFNVGSSDITIVLKCTTPNQFFAVGLGTSMVGADIWAVEVIGGNTVQLTDRKATARSLPPVDSVNDLTLLGYYVDSTVTIVKFKRNLNTGDSDDNVITPGVNQMIWATTPGSPTIAAHGSTNRGYFNATFVNGFTGTVGGASMMGDYTLPSSYVAINSYLTMYFSLSTTEITVALKCTVPNQFFAVGLGMGMIGADIWAVEIVGGTSVLLTDRMATAKSKPPADAQNDLTLLGYYIDSTSSTVKFKRLLNTGDTNDVAITGGLTPMMWATSTGNTEIKYHGTAKGTFYANLVNGYQGPPQNALGSIVSGDVTVPPWYFIVNGMLTVYFNVEGSYVDVGLSFSAPFQYFGIGFGSTMQSADMWVVECAGNVVTVTDSHSGSYSFPVADSTNDLTVLGYELNGTRTYVHLKRNLVTGDANDRVINVGYNYMMWATSGSRTLDYHGQSRGLFKAPFENGFMGYAITLDLPDPYRGHAILMILAWGALYDVSLLVIRLLKDKKNGLFVYVHSATMWATWIISIVAFVKALNKEKELAGDYMSPILPIRNAHYVVGCIVVAFSCLGLVLGVAMLVMQRSKKKFSALPMVRRGHQLTGYLTYGLSKACIIIGAEVYKKNYQKDWSTGLIVYIALIGAVHLGLTFFTWNRKSKAYATLNSSSFMETEPQDSQHKDILKMVNAGMASDEVVARFPKVKWVMVGDMLYDLTGWNHPGGNSIIEDCTGREVTRFLNGSYGLENDVKMKPHVHSASAYGVLKGKPIGKLRVESVLMSKVGEATVGAEEVWSLEGKTQLTRSLSRFDFRNDKFSMKPFAMSLGGCGRHFSIGCQDKPGLKRLYTTALGLTEESRAIRAEILMALREKRGLNIDQNWTKPMKTVPFFIKRYDGTNGVSTILHDKTALGGGRITIEGPAGRGIDVGGGLVGTHVIVCAGTGILPFVDFLNFVFLNTAYKIFQSQNPQNAEVLKRLGMHFEEPKDFGVKLFVSFNGDNEVYGGELIESLSRLGDFGDKEVFEVFSSSMKGDFVKTLNKGHFTRENIEGAFPKQVKRCYVCGPPKFNNSVPQVLNMMGVPKQRINLV